MLFSGSAIYLDFPSILICFFSITCVLHPLKSKNKCSMMSLLMQCPGFILSFVKYFNFIL